jgi:pullulanase/glycogen debranching enzyme
LIEKIPYLQELGITAVELLPVFQFDPQAPRDQSTTPRCTCVDTREKGNINTSLELAIENEIDRFH